MREVLSLEEGGKSFSEWRYPRDHTTVHGAFRAISVDDLLLAPPRLALSEFSRSEKCAYAAISHVWEHSFEVEKIRVEVNRNLTIATKNPKVISWLGLVQAAKAAKHCKCQYLWLDMLCINQLDKDDKNRQILRMGDYYEDASVVLIMLGGISAVQGLETPSEWIYRSWTLQEAVICRGPTYVLTKWHGKSYLEIPIDGIHPTYRIQFNKVDEDLAYITLAKLLEMPTPPDTDLTINWAGQHSQAATAALFAVITSPKDSCRSHCAVWRSMFLRTTTNPQDMVYSVMHLLGVRIERFNSDRNLPELFLELAEKVARRGYPAWLTIGELAGDLLPRARCSAFLPQMLHHIGNSFPMYTIIGTCEKVDVRYLVSSRSDWVRGFDIRFLHGFDSICAHIFFIENIFSISKLKSNGSNVPGRNDDGYITADLRLRNRKDRVRVRCLYRGEIQKGARVIVIGDHDHTTYLASFQYDPYLAEGHNIAPWVKERGPQDHVCVYFVEGTSSAAKCMRRIGSGFMRFPEIPKGIRLGQRSHMNKDSSHLVSKCNCTQIN